MLGTAADVWREWVRTGVLRPADYDKDVADLVRRKVARLDGRRAPDDPVDRLLEAVDWPPRELLRAIAPAVASFSGMQRDLLALYARVGAASGTGENLRIHYEFAEDDVLDDSLENFREVVQRVALVTTHLRPFRFGHQHAWASPLRVHGTWPRAVALAGQEDLRSWRFDSGLPAPRPTGDAAVDALVRRYASAIDTALMLLGELGADLDAAGEWVATNPERAPEDLVESLYWAATDYWPLSEAAALHAFADAVRKRELSPDEDLVGRVEVWLDGFESGETAEVTTEQTVEEVLDVLSLPTWGRRHELYSAWVATQLDQALCSSRLSFVVTDGALRFPFRATLLAQLDSPGGDVELWCEVRSGLDDPVGHGRTAAIQPDYRFVRRAPHGGEVTVAAIEVKQYLRAATKDPGDALRDYAAGLPEATILLVAHGPLGAGVQDRVRDIDRGRTEVHPHVRPGRPHEAAQFRAAAARLFPVPPADQPAEASGRDIPGEATNVRSPIVTRIELRWSSTVRDLDLHLRDPEGVETSWENVSTSHSSLRADAFDGGPEVIELRTDTRPPLELLVLLFSSDALSVDEGDPRVTLIGVDGDTLVLTPRLNAVRDDPRCWSVALLDSAGRATPSPGSMVSGPTGAREQA